MTRLTRLILPLLLTLPAGSGFAADAPSQLQNKTVTMSWSTSGTATAESGASRSFSNVNTRTVYISTAGRLFLRKQITSTGRRGASRSGEVGPGEGGQRGSIRFEGGRLVGAETFMSGARQYVATFDSSYTSCTLSVIDAKAGGAAIKRRGPNGMLVEVTGVTTSSPSCSIESGNAVARE